MKNLKIIDYSLTDLVAVVSIEIERPNPNTFSFSFSCGDVAVAAIELGIIDQPWDLETGKGQQFRIGYMLAGEKGNVQYFSYKQVIDWISGDDREAIVLNLAMQKPEISNQILQELI